MNLVGLVAVQQKSNPMVPSEVDVPVGFLVVKEAEQVLRERVVPWEERMIVQPLQVGGPRLHADLDEPFDLEIQTLYEFHVKPAQNDESVEVVWETSVQALKFPPGQPDCVELCVGQLRFVD